MKKKALVKELDQFAKDMAEDAQCDRLKSNAENWFRSYSHFLTEIATRAKEKAE